MKLKLHEFARIEYIVGAMDTDGLETLRVSRRMPDGEVYLAVDHPARPRGRSRSLAEWASLQRDQIAN